MGTGHSPLHAKHMLQLVHAVDQVVLRRATGSETRAPGATLEEGVELALIVGKAMAEQP